MLALTVGGVQADAASKAPSSQDSMPSSVGAEAKPPLGAESGDTAPQAAGPDAGPTTDNALYAYDAAGRLVGVTDPGGETARYRYDKAGNRLGIDRFPSSDLSVLSLVPARAAAGAKVTLSGTGFAERAADNTVIFGGKPSEVVSASATRLVVVVPSGAGTGKVSVVTGGVTAESYESFTLSSPGPSVTGIEPQSGAPGSEVTLSGSDFARAVTDNVVRFGGGITAEVVSQTDTALTVKVPPDAITGTVDVTTPDGVARSSDSFEVLSAGGGVVESSETTTYTDPDPPTVSVTTPGNRAEVRFDAGEGDALHFGFTESTFNTTVSLELIAPDGDQVASGSFPSNRDAVWRVSALPLDGQYTLLLIPGTRNIGAARVTVSKPVTGVLKPEGGALEGRFGRAGQGARLTLDGEKGQSVSLGLGLSGLVESTSTVLYAPDGSRVEDATVPAGHAGGIDIDNLPETGVYTLALDPSEGATGAFNITASYYVDAGTLSPRISWSDLAIGRVEQNGIARFDAEVGADLSLGFTENTFTSPAYVSVFAPSGAKVVNRAYLYAGKPKTLSLADLPETGVYRVVVNPSEGAIGTLRLMLSADVRFALAVDGDSSSVVVERAGQIARGTFTAETGTHLSLGITENTFTSPAYVSVFAPSGAKVVNRTYVPPGKPKTLSLADLLETGSYTVLIEADVAGTGTMELTLSADVRFALAVDGDSSSVVVERAGQIARGTFTAETGTHLSLGITENTFTSPAYVSVFAPSGAKVVNRTYVPPGKPKTLSLADLPETGSYTVLIEADVAGTGTMELTLSADVRFALAVDGDSSSVVVERAGQIARGTFTAETGTHLSLGITENTFTSPAYVSVFSPSGAKVVNRAYLYAGKPKTLSLADLPETGSYTVLLESEGAGTGTTEMSLQTQSHLWIVPGLRRDSSSLIRPGPLTEATAFGIEPTALPSKKKQPEKASTRDTDKPRPQPQAAESHDGVDPTGPDAWQPRKTNLAGRDWVTLRGNAAKAPARLRAPPGRTALTGHVVKLDGKPLAKVTVSAGDKHTRTDAKGRFLLAGIAPETTTLVVDGSSANTKRRQYGRFDIRVRPKDGVAVDLGFPVWMTPLDTKHTVRFDSPARADVVLTTPKIPGLEVRIPKGSVIRDEDGKAVTELGITAIPLDRPPFPLPKNSVVPVYFTVQPGGTHVFPDGAQIIYPNYTKETPGTRVEFMDYDPKKKGWHVYGHGKVSADGKQVVPDKDTRVWAFHGAMFNVSDLVPWDLSQVADVFDWLSGDPVHLQTGQLTDSRTDLAVADPIAPAEVTRTYWQGDTRKRAFGIGQDLSYNAFLHSKKQYQEVDLYLPGGKKIHFTRTSPGKNWSDAVFEPLDTPTQFHGSKIVSESGDWILRFRDGVEWVFPQYAALKEIRDRHGNTTKLTRLDGKKGEVTRITTPGGRWISLTYDAEHRVREARDNTGRTTSYTYDSEGRLETVTDPAGQASSYTYDGTSNRVATATDARGITYLTNTFGTDGRVKEQTLTEGQKYTFEYTQTGDGNVTSATVVQPGGTARRVEFDTDGYGVSDTQAYGTELARKTTYERGANHRVAAIIDPYGRRTEPTYDDNGFVTGTTELAGTAEARPRGTVSFDGPYGQPTQATDPLGNATTFDYGPDGNLQTATDPEGRATGFTYTSDGRIKTVTDASGAATEYTYRNGDLVQVKDAEGRISGQFVDAAGRPTALTDAAGSVTAVIYDKLNQTRKVTDPLGQSTTFSYDANGNVTHLTDARNNTTTWAFDQADRPTSATDPLGARAAFEYDATGRLEKATSRSGQVATAEYDLLGRVKNTKYGIDSAGQAQSAATYAYDSVDLLQKVTDTAAGNQSFSYDVYDRLHATTGPTGTVDYTYDAANRRKGMTAAGVTTAYGYDTSGILTSVTNGNREVTFDLDAVGRETTATLPGGITRSTGYDKVGTITSIAFARGDTTIGDLRYARDARGLQTALTGTLANVALPAAESGTTFDKDNRIAKYNGRSFTYDKDGQLKSDGLRDYTWDARGQLAGLTKAGENSSFRYGPIGNRTSKTLNGSTGKFLTDGPNPLVEQTASGESTATVTTSGIDEFLTRTEDGKTQIYLTDALGSVIGLMNQDGTIATTYAYDPNGTPTELGESSSNSHTFTGREDDGTGLLYYRNRYYDPETSRFISQDPIGHAGGTNLYQYALSSPTTYTDPSGLSPLIAGCAAGALVDGGLDWLGQRLSGRKVNWGQVGTSAAAGCLTGMLGGVGVKYAAKTCKKTPNSFTGDTRVLMADGTRKPIKDVMAGEKVIATDPETGESGPRQVTTLIRGTGEKDLVDVTINTGVGAGPHTATTITATEGHPFWIPELRIWAEAGNLEPGQWLQTSAGTWVQIAAVQHHARVTTVYNLTVDDLHTYYVLAGSTPVLVHNTNFDVCPVWVVDSNGVATRAYKLRRNDPDPRGLDAGANDNGSQLLNRQELGDETERRRSAVAGAPARAKGAVQNAPHMDGAPDAASAAIVAAITAARAGQMFRRWMRGE